MTDREAIRKAENECRRASYHEECGANAGIRSIYRNRAEWLSRLVFLAKCEIERLDKEGVTSEKNRSTPILPENEFVFHVIRFRSKYGAIKWIVKAVRWASYLSRMKHYGDDGLYFSTKEKAAQVAEEMNEKGIEKIAEERNVGELDYFYGNPLRNQSD